LEQVAVDPVLDGALPFRVELDIGFSGFPVFGEVDWLIGREGVIENNHFQYLKAI